MKKEDIEIDDLTPKELSDILMDESENGLKNSMLFGCQGPFVTMSKVHTLAASYLQKIADGEYKPVIHAHWADTRLENSTGDIYECSACGELYNPEKKAIQLKRQSKNPDYCPNCGASMDGNKNNDWLNMKYRKKPIEVEAFCLDFRKPMPEWFFNKVNEGAISYKVRAGACGERDISADIKTLEGIMHASRGDYIIKGVNGEIYPCKPNIFKKTYEPVSDESVNQNE